MKETKLRFLMIALAMMLSLALPALAVDSDSDGLDDLVESNSGVYIDEFDTGTDPINPDTDGDGVNDGHEVNYGSHPLVETITPTSWKSGSDVRITNDPIPSYSSLRTSLVWTGTEYGLSWYGNGNVYFARLDMSGVKIGIDANITSAPGAKDPSLVWTGSEYGLSWFDLRDGNFEIYFARISASGTKIGSDTRITDTLSHSNYPSLVWTGSEYGVSWYEMDEIYFARISASGAKIGSDIRITNALYRSQYPSLFWADTEYGVSWQDERDDLGNPEIYFARIDALGNKIGSDVRITNDPRSSELPSLVWTGYGYGLSWSDDRDGNDEIYFTRIDGSGNKIGADMRITTDAGWSYNPYIVWTGTEYGVSWNDDRDGNYEIYFARIDDSGTKIGSDVRITNYAETSGAPSIAWTGSEYGVVWYDFRDGNAEIYLARIGLDEDGDGLDNEAEQSIGTDPNDWDTDGDGISDYDEYYGETDPLVWDPSCGPSLYYYGDQDGDGVATLIDTNRARENAALKPVDYSLVYPSNGDAMDLDANSSVDLVDVNILRSWSLFKTSADADQGTPTTITFLSPPDFTVVPVGATIEIILEVRSSNGELRPGVGVMFEVLSGPATLFGGRGRAWNKTDPDTGLPYPPYQGCSVTGMKADGATAKIILRRDGPGQIVIRARIPKSPQKQLPSTISAILTLN